MNMWSCDDLGRKDRDRRMTSILLCIALYASGATLDSDAPIAVGCVSVEGNPESLARSIVASLAPHFDVVSHSTGPGTLTIELVLPE